MVFTPHASLYTLYFPNFTPHSSRLNIYSSFLTCHSLLRKLHSLSSHFALHSLQIITQAAPHSSLPILHYIFLTPHTSVNTPHASIQSPHSSQFTTQTPHSSHFTPQYILLNSHNSVHRLLLTLHSSYFNTYFSVLTP